VHSGFLAKQSARVVAYSPERPKEKIMSLNASFVERQVFPVRIVWPKADVMNPLRLSSTADEDGPGTNGPTVLLDFGKELFGGVRFEVATVAPRDRARLRVRLGESVSEAVAGCFDDRTLEVRARQSVDFGTTGFRFLRIDLVEKTTAVELTGLGAYGISRDLEYRGMFRCNDELLNRIWDTGAYTVHLCMQKFLWDGIKRGRSVWAGDLYPAANVVSAVFGDHSVVPESLDYVRDKTLEDGFEPLPWMNGIAAYSLWWVIAQEEWYLHHGQMSYLEGQRAYLRQLLPIVFEHIDDAGRERLDGWRFLDWATASDETAIHCGFQGLTAWALRAASRLCEILGEDALRNRCASVLRRIAGYQPPATQNKQAWALLTLGGLADAAEANRVVFTRNPAAGLSPFLAYPVLEARARAGDYLGCLELIRTYWGAMINLGATTFWEDFDLDWGPQPAGIDEIVPEDRRDIHADFGRCSFSGLSQSLCHGWSAGPTAWLSRHVLGIEPAAPGCRVVRIRPHLGNLQWAEGAFPTSLGIIRVRHHRREDGTIHSDVEPPSSIQVLRD
jgi:alpha-L-rhamnosidase